MELRVERMVAGGDGLARHEDGRVVFVRGGLPGETVRAEVVRRSRDFLQAQVSRIIEPSPARIEPPCPHVGRGCGGCGWQHIDTVAQMEMKIGIVIDALRRLGRIDEPRVGPGSMIAGTRLRTTVRVATAPDGRVGFRAARSHRVVTVDDCLVAHPAIAGLLDGLRAPGIPELSLRIGARTGELAGWAGDEDGVASGGPRPTGLPAGTGWGRGAAIHEIVHGRRLRVSAGAFFQSSPEAAEALVDAVSAAAGEWLQRGSRPVIDAYGGVGLFAAAAVPAERAVIVIEVNPASVADARANLVGRPAEVHESTVEQWQPVAADLVIADPARAGLGREAIAVLDATGCRRLVLVSCDAAALGRDTALLTARGLRHHSSVVLDPFPHTPHVEVVTRFDREPASTLATTP